MRIEWLEFRPLQKKCKKYYSLINESYLVISVQIVLSTSYNKQGLILEATKDAKNTF